MQVPNCRLLGINPQVPVERGKNFLEGDWPVDGFASQSVGRSDHLAMLHPSASHQGAGNSRPVIATPRS